MVFQHFSLFEAMSVVENIALALPPEFPKEGLPKLIEQKSAEYGIPLRPHSLVADLSVGEQQRVEIMRCLLQDPSLLIMDEPTSVLTPQETMQLFDVLVKLAKQGCAVLFISHKLEEIKQLTSRATILRGGDKIAEVVTQTKSTKQLAELMVGTKIAAIKPPVAPKNAPAIMQITGLSRPADGPFDTALRDINLTAHAGEVLGIAGIAGNGQSELMDALTGEWRGTQIGVFKKGAEDISQLNPAERRLNGLAFVPEERNGHAAVPSMRLSENALLTSFERAGAVQMGVVNQNYAAQFADRVSAMFDVRRPEANPLASALSGGNLQKFVVGREIAKKPELLIVSQPTWGVDVGAAQFIRKAMIDLAAGGASVIVISQDLEEIFAVSHKIAVLHEGSLSKAYPAAEMNPQTIGLLMGGSTIDNASKTARTISKKTNNRVAG
jgi:simple sugar transport system ATP-binding protein